MSGCQGCSFRGMSTAVEDTFVGVRFREETSLTLCMTGGQIYARGANVVVDLDGTFDRVTGYGGDAVDRPRTTTGGAAGDLLFEFPADEATRALFEREKLTASRENVWILSLGRQADPARRLVYELRRPGRHFRIEFDLTQPVPLPPGAWGFAPGPAEAPAD